MSESIRKARSHTFCRQILTRKRNLKITGEDLMAFIIRHGTVKKENAPGLKEVLAVPLLSEDFILPGLKKLLSKTRKTLNP